jgi:hypothetical protein
MNEYEPLFDTLAEANDNLCLAGCGNDIPNSATLCDDCSEAGMWDANRAYEYGE